MQLKPLSASLLHSRPCSRSCSCSCRLPVLVEFYRQAWNLPSRPSQAAHSLVFADHFETAGTPAGRPVAAASAAATASAGVGAAAAGAETAAAEAASTQRDGPLPPTHAVGSSAANRSVAVAHPGAEASIPSGHAAARPGHGSVAPPRAAVAPIPAPTSEGVLLNHARAPPVVSGSSGGGASSGLFHTAVDWEPVPPVPSAASLTATPPGAPSTTQSQTLCNPAVAAGTSPPASSTSDPPQRADVPSHPNSCWPAASTAPAAATELAPAQPSEGAQDSPRGPLRRCLRLVAFLVGTAFQGLGFAWLAATHGLAGLVQAHHPLLTYRHLHGEVDWRACVLKCLMLDVVLFRGLLYVYERLLPPLIESVFGVQLGAGYELAVTVLWAAPVYAICEVVTTILHMKMAKAMTPAADPPPSGPADSGSGAAAAARPAASGSFRTGPGGYPPGVVDEAVVAAAAAAAAALPSGSDTMTQVTSMVYTRLVYLFFVLQMRVLCSLPGVGTLLTLVLSALLHAYDCFEFVWDHMGIGVADRFALIEGHWLFFLGYGGLLASCSLSLRFWDLFTLRAVLYPLYIANAPHARFAQRGCRPLRVFRPPLVLFNACLQFAAHRSGKVE